MDRKDEREKAHWNDCGNQADLTIEAKYSIPDEISFAIWSKVSKLSFSGGSVTWDSVGWLEIRMQAGSWRAFKRWASGPRILWQIIRSYSAQFYCKRRHETHVYLKNWFRSPFSMYSNTIFHGDSSMQAPWNRTIFLWVNEASNAASLSKSLMESSPANFRIFTCYPNNSI